MIRNDIFIERNVAGVLYTISVKCPAITDVILNEVIFDDVVKYSTIN